MLSRISYICLVIGDWVHICRGVGYKRREQEAGYSISYNQILDYGLLYSTFQNANPCIILGACM